MTITKVWNLGASLDILGSHSVSIFNHIDAIAWNPPVKSASCPLLRSLHEYKVSTSLLCFHFTVHAFGYYDSTYYQQLLSY